MEHNQSRSQDVIVLSLSRSQYLSHAVARVTEMLIPRHPANRYAAEFRVDLSHEDGHGEIIVTLRPHVPFSAGCELLESSLASLVSSLENRRNQDDRGASRVLREVTMNGLRLRLPLQESPRQAVTFSEDSPILDNITCTVRFEFAYKGVGAYMPHSRLARFEVELDGWPAEVCYLPSGNPRLQLADIRSTQLRSLFEAVEANVSNHLRTVRKDVDEYEGLMEELDAQWQDGG